MSQAGSILASAILPPDPEIPEWATFYLGVVKELRDEFQKKHEGPTPPADERQFTGMYRITRLANATGDVVSYTRSLSLRLSLYLHLSSFASARNLRCTRSTAP